MAIPPHVSRRSPWTDASPDRGAALARRLHPDSPTVTVAG
jgi:hypothetical protein